MEMIKDFSIEYKTDPIKSQGHELFIKNDFLLNKDIMLCCINELLKKDYKISDFEHITPYSLFENKFSKRSPLVKKYADFSDKLYNKIAQSNKKVYKTMTKDHKDFDELRYGWKTAILLDIVLSYDSDIAPMFIDQPADNLATNYIKKGLVESIKISKGRREILVISHNATIPMLVDARNVIYCKNKDGCNEIDFNYVKLIDAIYNGDEVDIEINDFTNEEEKKITELFEKIKSKSKKREEDEKNLVNS